MTKWICRDCDWPGRCQLDIPDKIVPITCTLYPEEVCWQRCEPDHTDNKVKKVTRNPDFGEYDGDGGKLKEKRTIIITFEETNRGMADVGIRESRNTWKNDISCLLATSRNEADGIYADILKYALTNCSLGRNKRPLPLNAVPAEWGSRDPSLREYLSEDKRE